MIEYDDILSLSIIDRHFDFIISPENQCRLLQRKKKLPLFLNYFLPNSIIYLYIHYVASGIAQKLRLQFP